MTQGDGKQERLSQSDLHDWPDAGAGDQSISSGRNEFISSQMSWVKDMKDNRARLLLYITYSLTHVCCSKHKEQ